MDAEIATILVMLPLIFCIIIAIDGVPTALAIYGSVAGFIATYIGLYLFFAWCGLEA